MAAIIKSIEAPAFQRTSGSRKTGGKDAREFALGVDALILKALNNPAINKVFKSFVQVSIDAQFGLNLAQGIPISHATAPELYAILRHCSQTAGYPPALYHHFQRGQRRERHDRRNGRIFLYRRQRTDSSPVYG